MTDSSEDIESLVADLAEKLEALEHRLDGAPRRRRTLLAFTEQYAIPTAVALLEANIRVLETIGGAIRLADGREPRERPDTGRETALATLDRTLSEVSDAVAGTPTDSEARALLSDARTLRDEIQSRVGAAAPADRTEQRPPSGSRKGTTIPVADQHAVNPEAESAAASDAEADVDVDAELDTIREEVHDERAGETRRSADEDRSGPTDSTE